MNPILAFLSRRRPLLRILDDGQQHLTTRYGGTFRIEGGSVFDEQGRLRGFVFNRHHPSAARMQAFVAGARRHGLISEEQMGTLLACIHREDFVLRSARARGADVVVFPADIYGGR